MAALEAQPGNHLQIVGSGNLIQSLQSASLIDEHILWTFPVILGRGKRLFGTTVKPEALRLVSTKASATGSVQRRTSRGTLVVAALIGCADPRSGDATQRDSLSAEHALPARDGAARLDSAARRVVAFLQGEAALDTTQLADTVVLRLAPEGGAHEVRLPRAALRVPAAWTVPAGRTRYTLAPPAGMRHLTTAVGRHFNCQASTLGARAPGWAAVPHVGVRLMPDNGAESCLRSWNATFVFDTTAADRPPQLVGVLYDQWEW